MSDTDKKRKELEKQIKIEMSEVEDLIQGIDNCTDRLRRGIAVDAPMFFVKKEVEMIQYRALSVLSLYEAYALVRWVMSEPDKE